MCLMFHIFTQKDVQCLIDKNVIFDNIFTKSSGLLPFYFILFQFGYSPGLSAKQKPKLLWVFCLRKIRRGIQKPEAMRTCAPPRPGRGA